MHNPESVLQMETCTLLWDMEIQTDHLITTRRPHREIINKKMRTNRIVKSAVSADHRVKLHENKHKHEYLDLAWELRKLWNMKVTVIPIVNVSFGTVTKGLMQKLGDLKIRGRLKLNYY